MYNESNKYKNYIVIAAILLLLLLFEFVKTENNVMRVFI